MWAALAQVPAGLQYGALGLCAVMVLHNAYERRAQAKELDRRAQVMEGLIQANTAAMNRLAGALGDRPCLADDSRVRDPTEAGA